jgi:hypothetical protein
MGQFANKIRAKLGLEPKKDVTLTGKLPNEVVINRDMNEEINPKTGLNPYVLAPARMNGPTTGHGKLVEKIKGVAKQNNAPYNIVLTRTNDKPTARKTGTAIKNPLTPEQKLNHARKFFPGSNINLASPERPNLLSQASEIHKMGHNHLIVVAGADRVPEYQRLLNQYNGKEGPHGHFNFKKIDVVSAGERDPTATGVEGVSASMARKLRADNDYKTFRERVVPPHVDEKSAQEYWNDLGHGMGLNEEAGYPVSVIPTKGGHSTRPLVDPPIDGEPGDVGYDTDLDKGDKTNLRRRKAYKRLVQVGMKEDFDDIAPGTYPDSVKTSAFAPTETPVPTRTPVPTVKAKKTFGKIREGMFAADISNGDTGESGSPNNSDMSVQGVPVTAKETSLRKTVKKRLEEAKAHHERSNLETAGAGQRVKVDYNGKSIYGRIHNSHEGSHQIVLDDGSHIFVNKDHDHIKVSMVKESADYAAMHVGIPTNKNDNDDSQELKLPETGGLQRGTKVKIKKPGYEGHGNIDFFDDDSGKYIVSVHGYGHNLHLDKDDIEVVKEDSPCWKDYEMVGMKKKGKKEVPNCVPKEEIELGETKGAGVKMYNDYRSKSIGVNTQRYAKQRYQRTGILPGSKTSTKDSEAEFFAKGGKVKKYDTRGNPIDESSLIEQVKAIMERGEDSHGYKRSTESGAGLTRKGAKHFGIKTAVTRKNVDPDSEAGKRRKSFCARMSGMPGPMKDEKGRPTRKAMSLKRWRCRTEDVKESAEIEKSGHVYHHHIVPMGRSEVLRTKQQPKRLQKKKANIQSHIQKLTQATQTWREKMSESKNTPYVRPHTEAGSTKQSGWKASDKHGKVKYFGMDFKSAAERHAYKGQES